MRASSNRHRTATGREFEVCIPVAFRNRLTTLTSVRSLARCDGHGVNRFFWNICYRRTRTSGALLIFDIVLQCLPMPCASTEFCCELHITGRNVGDVWFHRDVAASDERLCSLSFLLWLSDLEVAGDDRKQVGVEGPRIHAHR